MLTHHYSKIFLYHFDTQSEVKIIFLNSIIWDDCEKLTFIPLPKS